MEITLIWNYEKVFEKEISVKNVVVGVAAISTLVILTVLVYQHYPEIKQNVLAVLPRAIEPIKVEIEKIEVKVNTFKRVVDWLEAPVPQEVYDNFYEKCNSEFSHQQKNLFDTYFGDGINFTKKVYQDLKPSINADMDNERQAIQRLIEKYPFKKHIYFLDLLHIIH